MISKFNKYLCIDYNGENNVNFGLWMFYIFYALSGASLTNRHRKKKIFIEDEK